MTLGLWAYLMSGIGAISFGALVADHALTTLKTKAKPERI